jgi:hypothetical protein
MMIKISRFVSLVVTLVLPFMLIAGCTNTPATTTTTTSASSATTTSSAAETTSATTRATTSAATSATPAPTTSKEPTALFHIAVIPEQLNGFSIAGQKCVFLVSIADESPKSKEPAEITASAAGAKVSIYKKAILEGQIAEVFVIPAQESIGKSIKVTFSGKRGDQVDKKVVTFDVIEGEDDRQTYAAELKTKFVTWLSANHPELGITPETKWTGTMVSPQWLVVSHYLFFSDEWEMHVDWHIMVPPYDWARIDLRKRYTESKPSLAFEIASITAKSNPKPMEVPETIWR